MARNRFNTNNHNTETETKEIEFADLESKPSEIEIEKAADDLISKLKYLDDNFKELAEAPVIVEPETEPVTEPVKVKKAVPGIFNRQNFKPKTEPVIEPSQSDKFIKYSMNENRIFMSGFTGIGHVRLNLQDKDGNIIVRFAVIPQSGKLLIDNDKYFVALLTVNSKRHGDNPERQAILVEAEADVFEALNLPRTVTIATARKVCKTCGKK